MTKQEQLTKLISLAVENGYVITDGNAEVAVKAILITASLLPALLFSHDFAKAIWGERLSLADEMGLRQLEQMSGISADEMIRKKSGWKFHLQQAVISDDPLQYYWENK